MNIKRLDRNELNSSDRFTLENRVLPAARRWLEIPGLRQHGIQTLEAWGETYQKRESD